MSELSGLFHDYSANEFDVQEESRSVGPKLFVGIIVAGLVVAIGAIAYFGVGPMLVKPYAPPVQSNAPDVAAVLGLGSSQSSSGITTITNEQTKQQLLQRLAAEVNIPEGEQVSVLLVEKVPQHTADSLFAKAAEGDVLLVLMQTGSAYLYRPSEDKIVASGTASVSQ